ncbi:MAG: hypothetical protein WCC00_07355 [Candidatus Aminicenantales bacterium]
MRRAIAAWLLVAAGLLLSATRLPAQYPASSFYQKETVYLDWNGSRYSDGIFSNQVSARVKFVLIDPPGQGWTLDLDARDRVGIRDRTTNQLILYSARLTFDKPGSRFYLSLGQMNLYDTAGIGALLGGMAGIKLGRDFLVGAFGGLESTPYIARLDSKYYKAGAFVRWLGPQGRTAGLTVSQLMFDGSVERRFAYGTLFLPVRRILVLYGDAEYELGRHVAGTNRLSRLFGNIRLDLGSKADVTASYSSGKGLDFHRYLIEASQDPTLFNQDVERFYYSSYYGVRFSLKPVRGLRLSVARQESRQNDLGIVNHTWRFGASVWNFLMPGLTVVGNYALNRGDLSESDSYYVSLTKDLGRFSLNASFSNTFRGLRFDPGTGEPLPITIADYRNVALGTLIRLGRELSASIEYGGFLHSGDNEHFLFVRLIYRSR